MPSYCGRLELRALILRPRARSAHRREFGGGAFPRDLGLYDHIDGIPRAQREFGGNILG